MDVQSGVESRAGVTEVSAAEVLYSLSLSPATNRPLHSALCTLHSAQHTATIAVALYIIFLSYTVKYLSLRFTDINWISICEKRIQQRKRERSGKAPADRAVAEHRHLRVLPRRFCIHFRLHFSWINSLVNAFEYFTICFGVF